MSISFKPLFKTLIDKGKKRQHLRDELKLSPNIIAKFEQNKYVSLKTIDDICTFLDCSIADVVEHIKE